MRCRLALIPMLPALLCGTLALSCAKSSGPSVVSSALGSLGSMNESEVPGYVENLEREDPIGLYYRDPATREATLQFFTTLTHSENVSRVILEKSSEFKVRTALAFALALEESDFRIDALNRNGDSVDRGLFQLNSKSYPRLQVKDFYDPALNAHYGIAHLKGCLLEAGNEVAALAMYNAGTGRVTRGATPKKTLNYVSRILAYEGNIASLFAAKVIAVASRAEATPSRGLGRLVAESVGLGMANGSSGAN
jgi:hypothetical protein